MKNVLLMVMLAASMMLSACTEPGRYPVSGAPCADDDPVKDLGPLDCNLASGV